MFTTYVSDTTAGSANQTWFETDGRPHVGRVYYRLSCDGDSYALLYSNVIDSTFADGSRSVCNEVCNWEIVSLCVGLCAGVGTEPSVWHAVTFGGKSGCRVDCETLWTDPVALTASAGDTLCVECCAAGTRLPCHEELQIASFVRNGDAFCASPFLPVPSMVGVRRSPRVRLGFLGDSITQGIGATPDAYRHWAARVASSLGSDTAVWDLGIGYARSSDAASGGAWLRKAAQNDAVVLCLGVNDLIRGRFAEAIAVDLETIIEALHARGVKVLLQAVPPFEFGEAAREQWRALNRTVKKTLAEKAEAFFDPVPYLCDESGQPFYGGHPNDEGCAVWATALTPCVKAFLAALRLDKE